MRSVRRWTIQIGLIGALVTGGGITAAVAAVHHDSGPSPMRTSAAPAVSEPITVIRGRVLKSTVFSQDGRTVTMPSGYQPVDKPIQVICPGVSGTCTIEADQHVQVTGDTANNNWAICTQVDGVFVEQPSCPFQGLVAIGPYNVGSFDQIHTGVAVGTHTVQTFLYTDSGADRTVYSIVYNIYKP